MTDRIKDYWDSQAVKHGTSHNASWGDNWMIDLEISTISKYTHSNDCVLDVGCANGYSTFRQLERCNLKNITGIDFSSKMIQEANANKKSMKIDGKINFNEGDIRSLVFEDNSFDLVYTTRVLINLPSWEEQMDGIQECIRVAKPGGTIILSEGFWEPLCLLNSIRMLAGLSPLVEHDFNRYIKLEVLKSFLAKMNLKYKIEDFSSVYYLGSRFLRELVTDTSKFEGFSNPINKIFFEIQKSYSGGGFGIQQAIIIEKKF